MLLVVGGAPTRDDFATAKGLGAEPVQVEVLAASHLKHDPSLVFDLDLRSVDVVRQLKRTLTTRGRGCRLFLVDPNNRVTSVHANVLGADLLLARPTTVAQMRMAIDEHFRGSNALLSDTQVMGSINAGAQALDSSFAALIADAPIDTGGVADASERIADAVANLGLNDWLAAVKGHHIGTFQHCMLVTGVAAAFASKTGMARRDVITLTVAGLMHDIGKATVPTELLDKAGALTAAETTVMRKHPVTGYDYLVNRSTLAAATLASVRHHHEFLDGTGYPDGLSGSEIDDLTRIITICDVYGALVERRSYKEPRSPAQAMATLDTMALEGKLEVSLVRELGRIVLPKGR